MSTGSALPRRVRRWCADALGQEVLGAARLTGGFTDAIWRISVPSGAAILRWLDVGHPHAADARQWIVREELGCRLTQDSVVPAPVLIATDTDGEATGGWANLTSLLPGRVRLDRLGPAAIDALADVAVAVHAIEVADDHRPPPFARWTPAVLEVPPWSRRPSLWAEAIERCRGPRPTTRQHLIHRDFHPGNTLWAGDVVTGLIDWAETSWGPSDLDVAHACSNFAMLHSVDAALAFERAYERRGGRLDPDQEARRYWTCLDVLGFLPDPGPVVVALTRQRPDLDAVGVRHRLEDLLALVLQDEVHLGVGEGPVGEVEAGRDHAADEHVGDGGTG
ncbi:MAG: phosphotransferase family protein [Janthinobacterium lividum]